MSPSHAVLSRHKLGRNHITSLSLRFLSCEMTGGLNTVKKSVLLCTSHTLNLESTRHGSVCEHPRIKHFRSNRLATPSMCSFLPGGLKAGNRSGKISGLKQTTVKSLGEPDALNPELVIGSFLTHVSWLVFTGLFIACALSPSLPALVHSCSFQEWWGPNVTLLLGEKVLPGETQAPHALLASVQTHGL